MIEPYTAVGLIPSFWGIRRREDIEKNLAHLESLTKAAFWLSSLDIPVRLVAIPEGALQGFNDEVLDVDVDEIAPHLQPGLPPGIERRLGAGDQRAHRAQPAGHPRRPPAGRDALWRPAQAGRAGARAAQPGRPLAAR